MSELKQDFALATKIRDVEGFVGINVENVVNVERIDADAIHIVPKSSSELLGLVIKNNKAIPIFNLTGLLNLSENPINDIELKRKIPTITLKVKEMEIILAIAEDPIYQEKKELVEMKEPSIIENFIDQVWQSMNSDEMTFILDFDKVFSNINFTKQVKIEKEADSEDDSEDDLDLSQYTL